VLLHDPLPSLVSARETAAALRMRLRRRFGQAVALNAALLVATAMRWSPPLATAAVKHGIALLLIEASSRLARSAAPSAPLHEAGTDPMSELKEESAT
jgi:cation transport ATPase